ncbi:Piwi-like protein 2 [Perkinsus olseni]|uniref:chorismate synthase n=1 Tax=Perkinsus olseni TaxID=32597 RepID=A0A7J6NAC3_PEROL|nr:Piwi-like protein 2 [Perkinsus olseni]
MSLPATKGFEIGSGFDGARTLRGSRNNDPFESGVDVDGLLHTATNNHGGTLGGITSGMPIYFRVCIKAASSIGMEQVTADFDGNTQTLAVKGRHDPCVLPRAPPLVESMAAIVTMDMLLRQRSRGRPIHTLRVAPFQWLLVTMANITDKGVAGAHGGNPQFLISQIVRDRVYSLRYWKEECFGLNAETILDKAAELKYVGTVYGPLQRPSPFLCLLVKLLQIGPEKEIIKSFIDLSAGDDAGELRYLRALACTYLRYIGRPEEIYNWLEPVLWDYRQIVVRKLDGSFEISNLDTWINTLLTEDEIITLGLPKLPQRHILEEREALKPFDWPPEVVEGLKEEPAEEPIEVDGDDKTHAEGQAEDGAAAGSRKGDDRSRSKSTDGERKHRHHRHHHHHHGDKKKKGADAEDQQEIDEANALRAKLGLKPLRTGSSCSYHSMSSSSSSHHHHQPQHSSGGMQSDDGLFPAPPPPGTYGRKVRLVANFFGLTSEVIATQGIQAYDIITVPSLSGLDRTSMRRIQDYLLHQVDGQLKPYVIESNVLYSPVKITTPLVAVDHEAASRISPAGSEKKSLMQPVTMTISLRAAKTAFKDRENGERAVYRMISKMMTTGTGLQPLGSGKSGAVMYFDTRRVGGNRRRGGSDGPESNTDQQQAGDEDNGRMPVPCKVVSGFSCSVCNVPGYGHQLRIDVLYRAVHRKDVLSTITGILEHEAMLQAVTRHTAEGRLAGMGLDSDGGSLASSGAEAATIDSAAEWNRRCENAIILALHNRRMYRVKCVRFDMSPTSTFPYKDKKTGRVSHISFVDFMRRWYNLVVMNTEQPMLECYGERKSEQVFMIPEFCALTGLTEEMRKDRLLMQEVLQLSRCTVDERMNACVDIVRRLRGEGEGAVDEGKRSVAGVDRVAQVLSDWRCTVSDKPIEIPGRMMDPVEVSFGMKRYTVEDGNFQRWTRNGAQCPVNLVNWILIFPESDIGLVDMWLRSMKELAAQGFATHIAEPERLVCTNQLTELRPLLLEKVKVDTQLVMLFTPVKDCKRVYQLFKQVCTVERPCITQVVRSETMRKKTSIVAIVTRIIMQISAKFLGPLWHIDLHTSLTPMMNEPCMLVGIDTAVAKETRRAVLGFVCSLDSASSQYFSKAVPLDADQFDISGVSSERGDQRYSDQSHTTPPMTAVSGSTPSTSSSKERRAANVARAIKECMKEALLYFGDSNDGILPTRVVVYRASVPMNDMREVGALEVKAVQDAFSETSAAEWDDDATIARPTLYCPRLTYILCTQNVQTRFFLPMDAQSSPQTTSSQASGGSTSSGHFRGLRNPVSGTVVDTSVTGIGAVTGGTYNFYLINQHVSRGSASPTHYTVAYDDTGYPVEAIQTLTYKLAFLYYNFPGGIRLPAPAQYAKKLAHLMGTAVFQAPHPRLKETLFYL